MYKEKISLGFVNLLGDDSHVYIYVWMKTLVWTGVGYTAYLDMLFKFGFSLNSKWKTLNYSHISFACQGCEYSVSFFSSCFQQTILGGTNGEAFPPTRLLAVIISTFWDTGGQGQRSPTLGYFWCFYWP